ncbi:hypothetical protein LVY75_00260 (plasmid) [Sinorhizobium sp. B11]
MLGKLIRVGRAERGLTAQEVADLAGISRTKRPEENAGFGGAICLVQFGAVLSLLAIDQSYKERGIRRTLVRCGPLPAEWR